jgi:hypothetical protein
MVLQDWPKGYTLAKSVITDYSNLKLTNTYSEIWDVTKENSSEIIFSVQFSVDQLVSGQNLNCVYFTPWYSKHPGIPQNPVDGGTWVMFKPTPYFYTLWDKTKDRRYAEGLKSVWLARSKATGKNGQTINIGDTALFYSIDVLSTAWKNSRKYAVYDVNDMPADDSAWPQPTKFRDETHTSNSLKLGRDVPVVRVAEMYLLAAEAAFRQDDITEARDLLNALRTKRAITGQDMSITSGQVSLDFILDEMGRELFGEGERWFVLKRMGKLVERVKLYNPYGAAANIQDFHTLRPIPQDQIDRTKGGYPQNTGYN